MAGMQLLFTCKTHLLLHCMRPSLLRVQPLYSLYSHSAWTHFNATNTTPAPMQWASMEGSQLCRQVKSADILVTLWTPSSVNETTNVSKNYSMQTSFISFQYNSLTKQIKYPQASNCTSFSSPSFSMQLQCIDHTRICSVRCIAIFVYPIPMCILYNYAYIDNIIWMGVLIMNLYMHMSEHAMEISLDVTCSC